jgi:hypothetical protein
MVAAVVLAVAAGAGPLFDVRAFDAFRSTAAPDRRETRTEASSF